MLHRYARMPHILFLSDGLETAGEVINYISYFFSNLGSMSVELISSGLEIYRKMLISAVDILVKDYSPYYSFTNKAFTGDFSDFWIVIDNVMSILSSISTTLITLLFVISLANDSWDTRHEMDFSTFFKSFAKFFAAIVLVNNSSRLVYTLFNLSSKVASFISGVSDFTNLDVSMKSVDCNMIIAGVSGGKGLIACILCVMVFLVIIASGITVMLEVYQRIFKIFVLIPFSCISFSAFAMSDNHRGAEIFHGYVKSILSVAIESVVIMIFIAFSLSLINGETMSNLFQVNDGILCEQYTVCSEADVQYITLCFQNKHFTENVSSIAAESVNNDLGIDIDFDDTETSSSISTTLYNQLEAHRSAVNKARLEISGWSFGGDAEDYANFPTVFNNYMFNKTSMSSDEQNKVYVKYGVISDKDVCCAVLDGVNLTEVEPSDYSYLSESNPATVYLYSSIGFFDLIVIIFKYLFPCLLCSTSVKMAGQVSGMIVGR